MTIILAVPAAASAMEVTIPYQQSFTNDSAEASVADTFDYQLTAANASSPMPEGSGGVYGFSLKGNTSGKLNLDISYPKPGYYYYTVKSKVDSPAPGYTYNKKTYTVMVMVVNGTDGLVIRAVTIQDADQNKYDSLDFKTKYYKERPGKKKKKSGGGDSNPAAVAPPEVPLDDTDVDIDNPPAPIYNPETPAIEPEEDWWALINLIAMLLTLLTAIIAGALYFKRRRNQNEEEPDPEDIEDPSRFRRSGWMRIALAVVAIVSLILFILTEDMTLPMRLVDEWTIWMIILLAIALLLALVSRKVTAEEEEDNVGTNPEG